MKAAYLLLLAFSFQVEGKAVKQEKPRIIVVGGGVAGLATAKGLVDTDLFEVTLLEAKNRVGGRVHSMALGEGYVENGAQFIHGKAGNPLWEYVRPYNVTVEENVNLQNELFFTFASTNKGHVLSPEGTARLFELRGKMEPGDNVTGSMGDFASRTMEEELRNGDVEPGRPGVNHGALELFHQGECIEWSCYNWFNVSVVGRNEYHEFNADTNWREPANYASLFGIILHGEPTFAPILQPEIPEWLLLNKQVNSIGWDKEEGSPVSVMTTDGSEYSADYLVFTGSLGVLKQFHSDMFSPALPEQKVKAINHMGFGCAGKIFLEFERRWWSEVDGPLRVLWEDDPQPPHWLEGLDEEALKELDAEGLPKWARTVGMFIPLSAPYLSTTFHDKVLMLFPTGNAAKLIEKLDYDEVKGVIRKMMDVFFGDRFDIGEEDFNVYRTEWCNNNHTLGAYSYRRMESEENDVWATDLAEPVVDSNGTQRIFFAGEATHSNYYSAVHGAFASALREVERIRNL